LSVTTSSVEIDPDVGSLPDGHGARLAIVVDDLGISDTYLAEYLRLPQPLTLSIIPFAPHAEADDTAVHAAGREILLHIPLANSGGRRGTPAGGLAVGTQPAAIDDYLTRALARVPHAIGANNHEGSYGSTQPSLMRPLLEALRARNLLFLDSVTAGGTIGYALAVQLGMPPRINNVFLDHLETDVDSRRALLELAADAAHSGTSIGICHVFHPYLLRALQRLGPQLEARGYRFAALSEVTNAPATAGLDEHIRKGVGGA